MASGNFLRVLMDTDVAIASVAIGVGLHAVEELLEGGHPQDLVDVPYPCPHFS